MIVAAVVSFLLCKKSTSVAEQYASALAFCCIVITAIVATIAADLKNNNNY
jgi:hypothetical protein